ncbi:transcriptional regulator [Actinopolymorpha sp. B17G11]|uniref:transcriptional regulator n=1 Tax=Actinopolymorpha sp. B17G11 TaxID=3160861 RepID=UPI0032E4D161
MYDRRIRESALLLLAKGLSLNAASKELGISRAALTQWSRAPEVALAAAEHGCPRCADPPDLPDRHAYAHLLGLYLGDGYISQLRKGVYSLRIFCDDHYPGLQAEAGASMRHVRPPGKVYRVPGAGCSAVMGLWKHWPCLFPQHGPGMKHTRPIVLESWQREIVEEYPGRFLRGLFHSDGCRITNWTVRTVNGTPKRYEYPRYFFTNASADIRALCTWALDLLGIAWRQPNPRQISVARREAVAALDTHVGPKP